MQHGECNSVGSASKPAGLTVSHASAIFLAFALPCFALGLKSYWTDVRIAHWPLEVGGYPALRDFANLWVAGIVGWSGDFHVLFDRVMHGAHVESLLGVYQTHPMWSYPPTAILLMMPFGLLPYAWACALWTAMGVSAYIAASGVVGASDRRAAAQRLGAIALCPGVFLCLSYGQTAFLTSAVLIVGILHAPKRPMVAGALLALLAIKPQIGIVVPFALLAMGAWRAIAATAFFTLLFCGLTVLVLGLEPWQNFIAVTLPQQFTLLTSPKPTDQLDVTLIISLFETMKRLGMSAYTAYGVQIVLALAVLAVLVGGLRRQADANLRVFMIACAVPLVSPYALTYELPILVLAVARIFGSPETLARLDERELYVLAASVTVGPFVGLTMLTYSGVNFVPLIPFVLLVALGTTGRLWPSAARRGDAYAQGLSLSH